MKRSILLAIRSVRPGLTLLAVLSITLFCASTAKAATIRITSNACNYSITARKQVCPVMSFAFDAATFGRSR